MHFTSTVATGELAEAVLKDHAEAVLIGKVTNSLKIEEKSKFFKESKMPRSKCQTKSKQQIELLFIIYYDGYQLYGLVIINCAKNSSENTNEIINFKKKSDKQTLKKTLYMNS